MLQSAARKTPCWVLKNVIIGKIIPAGTGMARYRKMEPKAVEAESESVYSITDTAEMGSDLSSH